MLNFIVILVLIMIIYFVFIRKFRIVFKDPITGDKKYVVDVDGIHKTFRFSDSQKSALLFSNFKTASQYLKGVSKQRKPYIEYRPFLIWKQFKVK